MSVSGSLFGILVSNSFYTVSEILISELAEPSVEVLLIQMVGYSPLEMIMNHCGRANKFVKKIQIANKEIKIQKEEYTPGRGTTSDIDCPAATL